MGNKKDLLIRITGGIVIVILLVIISIRKPHNMVPEPILVSKEDSLQNIICELESKILIEESTFDSQEQHYVSIISQYESGVSYLKYYHPEAYKDFHRIVGMREHYSHELERDNKKTLKILE